MYYVTAFAASALIAVASASSSSPSSVSGSVSIDAGHHCRPNITGEKKRFEPEAFSGVWYMDSSTVDYWAACNCIGFKFTYHKANGTHHGHKYNGYFTLALRVFGSDAVEEDIVIDSDDDVAGDDPCKGMHTTVHEHYYVLRSDTNLKEYALVFDCEKYERREKQLMMLLSRNKLGVPSKVREKMQAVLHEAGWTVPLKRSMNTEC